MADLDGDGDLDVVVGSSGQVSALLGDGDGYFSIERPLQMLVPGLRSINAGSLALADFNADGRVDVAIGEEWGNHVDVKLGNGDGTFGAAIGYFSGADSGIQTLVTGDLTGDGMLDLVAGSRNGILRVLAGNGDGSFANGVANATTASTISGLRLADLDRDGDLDVVGVANASNKPHRAFWLLGNGTATLGPVTHTPGGAMPSALELADMDRDARLDAVWVDPKSNALWTMLGADS